MFANQERVFRQHIKLALKTEKPMVLHLRGPNSLGKLNQKIYTTVRPRNNAALISAIFGITYFLLIVIPDTSSTNQNLTIFSPRKI